MNGNRRVGVTRSGDRPPPTERRRWRTWLLTRRGVASVLAMMFVVLFGSLAVAMAIVSKGNLRTAQTHLHVERAMGAAETGLAIAEQRLATAVSRFVISKGEVDGGLAWRLWSGTTTGADGTIQVLPPSGGYPEGSLPAGMARALANIHGGDTNIVTYSGTPSVPTISAAPAGASATEYHLTNWVMTPAVAIDGAATPTSQPAAYQITYAPLANGTDVRVIVTGYSSVGASGSTYHYGYNAGDHTYRPLSRVVQQDFQIVKRSRDAILSPSRIMIGKNVQVTGNMGAWYTDVAQNHGQPIVLRSDFHGLNPTLDQRLDALAAGIRQFDVDGDNRLRVNHPVESQGIPPGIGFSDVTRDGYVDDFDVFINFYDTNHDGKVTLSAALTQGTPAEGMAPEFTADDDLALLIDSAVPDRNVNGVSGYQDANHNGRWDAGETFNDRDPVTGANADVVLGYRDGFIDRKDQYAKIHGRLVFRVSQSAWEAAQGDYHQYLQGPIVPTDGQSPLRFSASDTDLPAVTAASFVGSQAPMETAANGALFDQQVAGQLGIAAGALPTYTEAGTDPTRPRYWRSNLADSYVFGRTGRHIYERMPFNSPVQAYADWYYRPRYENMVFRNVQIPRGTNALFVNCTFVGITYVHTYLDNTHPNWTLYGHMDWNPTAGQPTVITQPLDRSDFLRYTTGNPADGPANYTDFPNPPVIDGVIRTGAARDTKQYSNNIRFHDCLFVGSLVSDTPAEYTHVRNKFQFTGATRFTDVHPDQPADPALNPDSNEMDMIHRSSMMLPNCSVDIGQYNSPTDTFPGGPTPQNVNLTGTLVAGVLDARGNTTINGSLLLTFAPVAGQGPLQQWGQPVGNPASFNATLGYFGPADGDGESLDPNTLPIVDGHRIVGYDVDGDGIADVDTNQPQPPGSSPVPFYGYGRVVLNWSPDLPMPDGIMLPLSTIPLRMTYREGRN